MPPKAPARFLFQYVKRRGAGFAVLVILLVGGAACAVAVQYGMKLIVDAMASGDRDTGAIWRYLGFFLVLIATECILWRIAGWLGCRTIVASGVDIRLDLMQHLIGHPIRWFNEHLSGALGNRVTATAGASGFIYGTLAWRVLPPTVDFLGGILLFLTVDWRMAAALAVFVAIVAAVVTLYSASGRRLHRDYAGRASDAGGEVVDLVSNVWAVKAFSAGEREYRRLAAAFGVEAGAQVRSWMHLEKARVLHDICLCAMAGAMLAWAIVSWRNGASTPGDVVLISALTFRILHGSRDLALAAVEASQQMGVIAEMLGVIMQRHGVADRPNAVPFVRGCGAIRFDGVRYRHPRGSALFEHFDLDIPCGQRIGIVGPSGAGKSTLITLIQRLDDVQGGVVLIDGQPVVSVRQDTLREAMAVVPQEVVLLRRSIRENIRYGRPSATDDEVMAATAAAHCDEFLTSLPQGLDTVIGERGATFSGGQRQRIGIARAFLKDAPILLLDEATSALDSDSEAKIQAALLRLMQGRTVVAVAHRLSTVAALDRVIVLRDGRIIEDGPPTLLREQGGSYRRMLQLQRAEGLEIC